MAAGRDTLMTSIRMTEKANRTERAIVRPEDGTAGEDGSAGEDGTGGRAGNWGSEVITSITETQNEGSNHSQSRVYAHSI